MFSKSVIKCFGTEIWTRENSSNISFLVKLNSEIPSDHILICNPKLFLDIITANKIFGCLLGMGLFCFINSLYSPLSNFLKPTLASTPLISNIILGGIVPGNVKIPFRYESKKKLNVFKKFSECLNCRFSLRLL